jgi:hypothetical protein
MDLARALLSVFCISQGRLHVYDVLKLKVFSPSSNSSVPFQNSFPDLAP